MNVMLSPPPLLRSRPAAVGFICLAHALLAATGVAIAQPVAPPDKEAAAGPVNGFGEQLRAKPHAGAKRPRRPEDPIRPSLADDGPVAELEMFVGESRVIPSPGVGRIAVGNGSILTAAALDNKEVILFANGVGTSSLFVWNEDGHYERLKVNIVPGDTSRYAREIAAFLAGIPRARASVIGDKVILEGDDLSDSDLRRIDLLAARYPQIVDFTNRLGFDQMVLMDVKIAEFPVTELRELGLKWSGLGGATVGGIWSPIVRGGGAGYSVNVPGSGSLPVVNADGSSTGIPVPSGLTVRSALNIGLGATLNAMAQEGKTTILAEPQLSARNGTKASFLAGGEIPYAVSSILGTTVQFRSYGIKLDILPNVDRNGAIRASVDTEVSQLDTSVSSPGGPALLTRRIKTEFNVHSGETIVLSGLVQRESGTNVDKLPLLGDLPVLGQLFRSTKFQNKETELVVFVTPTVVDSRSPQLADRVEKARARLAERLGPPPHLSQPLQPASASGGSTPSRDDGAAPSHTFRD